MNTNPTTTRSPERTEFLTDVLITAVEGGIGYWSQATEYRYSAENPAERGVTLYVPAEDVDAEDYTVPVGHGVINGWGGEVPAYVARVTLDTIASAIHKIATENPHDDHTVIGMHVSYATEIMQASRMNDAGDIDSELADMIVQVAIFGSVVFG